MPQKRQVFLESHNIKNLAGGLGTFNLHLIRAISNEASEDLEITLNTPDPAKLKSIFGDRYLYKKYSSLQRHSVFRISKRYDVWHCLNQNISVEPGRKPGKYILTIHDVNFAEEGSESRKKKKMAIFEKKLLRADVITYISEFAKRQTHQYFQVPSVPEHIIYNGNPITEFLDVSRYQPEFPVDKPFFYSLGDFIERKNFTSIVRMMVNFPDHYLIISGNNDKAYGEEVRKLIADLSLSDRVFLTGKISDEGKQFYLQHCRAFLFPSIREGFGLPPIEAMRFGKPVFLSTETAMPEIGGDAAFYWTDFSADAMAETVRKKLSEFDADVTGYEQKLRERADSFSWEIAAKAYLEIYRS